MLFNDIDEFPYVTSHDGVSFDDLYHDYPPKDPSAIGRDSRYREANVIRRYAFVNVFEWHAVQLEAYLVRLMVDDRLKSAFRDDPAGRERERERIHHALHCVRGGIYYDYANEEVMERMAEAFPIDEADLRYLTERYLPTSVELGIEDTRACPY